MAHVTTPHEQTIVIIVEVDNIDMKRVLVNEKTR